MSKRTVKEFLFNGQSLDAPCKIIDECKSRTQSDKVFEGTVADAAKSEYADCEVVEWVARYNGVKVVIYIYVIIRNDYEKA
jgi:hypothetical protein